MSEETTMFDLFPDVEHRVLDHETPHARHLRALAARPRGRNPFERARHALGQRLIAVGSALVLEERATGRTLAR
jgi:hypothetical protein